MRRTFLAPLILAGCTVAACSSTAAAPTSSPTPSPPTGTATTGPATSGGPGAVVAGGPLVNPAGASVGTVELREAAGGLRVTVQASGLTPGFHGAHLHAVGKCEPNSPDPADPSLRGNFNSSGGHLSLSGGDHPNHTGDLPPLLAADNGTASLDTVTARLTRAALTDPDGTAFVVHERPDNFANIPSRYATAGADAETKKAGDSGARVACAVITGR